MDQQNYSPQPTAPYQPLKIIGFIAAFLMPVVGIVLNSIALAKLKQAQQSTTLSLWGLIVSIVLTIVSAVLVILFTSYLIQSFQGQTNTERTTQNAQIRQVVERELGEIPGVTVVDSRFALDGFNTVYSVKIQLASSEDVSADTLRAILAVLTNNADKMDRVKAGVRVSQSGSEASFKPAAKEIGLDDMYVAGGTSVYVSQSWLKNPTYQ